jgi:DNA-binding XRE family transcriptional regulator
MGDRGKSAAVISHGGHQRRESGAREGNRAGDPIPERVCEGSRAPYLSRLLNMTVKRRPTTDAAEILRRRYFAGKLDELNVLLEEERANSDVARQIYELRIAADLSQRERARLVGTTASVICQWEDADDHGHSLSMLRRIAAALNRRVEIRFPPLAPPKRTPARAAKNPTSAKQSGRKKLET